MLTLGFDTTILNVALPTMAEQLGAGTGQQQWMADAYIVVFAALMLPAGLLGDRFGRRNMLITGLGIFFVGSLVGTLAGDVNAVIAARAVTGVGAALVTPPALSVLPSLFAPDERTKAVGIVSACSTLGLPLGPIIGGRLLNHSMPLGSRTTVDSGYGFTALWLSIVGFGFGFGFSIVPAMAGALGTLPTDRAGSGSGLLMTLRQVGAAIGIALLGSLLASAFRDRLDVTGLPAGAADTAGDSVVAALASALLAAAFLPGTAQVDRSDAVEGPAEDAGPGLVTPAADARQ